MKVYIIKACAEGPFKEYKKYMAAPSQSIFSLAATTPKGVDIEMCDETIGMKVNKKSKADIIAIFCSTPDALRAYQIADLFKEQGKLVVMGGLHVKFNRKEALNHADALLIGECEGIWEELIQDYYLEGEVRQIYERRRPVDLATLKDYPLDLIPLKKYNYVWSVVVSRGCTNKCSFCLVHEFFDTMRYRPVDDVVNEIRRSGAKLVELHSDHLIANRAYAVELFEKLIPLGIKWVGETTLAIADDEELLDLAAKSGLTYLLVGIETISSRDLKQQGKGFMKVEKVKEQIAKLHKYGIIVDSGLLFGFPNHREDIFDKTLKFVNDIDLDIPHGIVPIPFPGSRFYKQLEKEGKMLTHDWSKYDGRHLVFQHDYFTEESLLQGIERFDNKAYDMKRTIKYYKMYMNMGLETM